MALAPGSRLGPYEIAAPLGAGGMGEVYRARDPRLGREVAIKVLAAGRASGADALRRFEQEARAAGGLNHPNVLAIYDAGSHDGAPYVVSELLEGETLRERLRGGPLSARRAMDYAVQTAHGLAAAHERGIVHRDLKPDNLFLTRDGRVKILDFGLAKLDATRPPDAPADPDLATAAIATPVPSSEPGMVLGTVGYMSPEQVRAQRVDHRSDIFSFGAILYEMLTGKRAFQGTSAVETMSAILKEDPPELAAPTGTIPAGFERVVRHCLEKNPEERFQSARDLAFNLQALSGLSGLSGALPGIAEKRASRFGPYAAAVAGAALLAALAFLVGRQLPRPSPAFQQITFKRGAILRARFAPDGQTVVYGAAWDGHPFQVFSARPGSPESRALGLPQSDILAISPQGEMALSLGPRFRGGFQFYGTLARAPLAGGAPREILENVYDAAWTPDGTALAVVRSLGGRDRLEYPVGKVLYETAGWVSHPRFSPRGNLIAFVDHPSWPDDAGSLVVLGLGGEKRSVSQRWESVQGLAWRDDAEVWFTAAPAGKDRALYAAALGGRQRLLARVPGRLTIHDVAQDGRVLVSRDSVRFEVAAKGPSDAAERDLSWLDGSMAVDLSPDGRTLLFYEAGEGGGTTFAAYVRGTDGTPAVRLGDGMPAALSPDGKWALTIRRSPSQDVVLLPTGPGEPRTLPRFLKDCLWAFWMPDGRSIVVNGAEEGRGLRSYLMAIDGQGVAGPSRPVTPEGRWGTLPSRDGTQLVASGTGQPLALYPIDGGEPRTIGLSRDGDRPIQWSPDGRGVFVFRRDELPCRVDRLDLRGGRETWKELTPADPAGVVAVHEVQITPDARAYAYSYVRILSELYVAEGIR